MQKQKGQALLIVVLVMVVALTVGLSVASRTITNLKVSTEEVNSQKAFSAAESGIEQSLKGTNVLQNVDIGNGAVIKQVNVQQVGGVTSFLLNNGVPLAQDDGADVWLTDYNTDYTKLYQNNRWGGTLKIYWGSPSDTCDQNPAINTQAAIEALLVTGTRSTPLLTHYAIDPCPARIGANNFSPANPGAIIQGKNFTNSATIIVPPVDITNPTNPANGGLIMRVIALYAPATIAITGSNPFPAQGEIINATGASGSTQRKVTYFQSYESLPSEFFYSVFSPR